MAVFAHGKGCTDPCEPDAEEADGFFRPGDWKVQDKAGKNAYSSDKDHAEKEHETREFRYLVNDPVDLQESIYYLIQGLTPH